PVELRAELRHLDLTVINVADDKRMEDFLNLPVDGLENVDLGWGHRPVSLIAKCACAFRPSPSRGSRSSAQHRRGRPPESHRVQSREEFSCRDRHWCPRGARPAELEGPLPSP